MKTLNTQVLNTTNILQVTLKISNDFTHSNSTELHIENTILRIVFLWI